MSKSIGSSGRRVASRPRKPAEKRVELRNKTFRLPLELLQRAEKRAIDEEKSLTEVVQEQLEVWAVGGAWERFIKDADEVVASHKDPPELDWKIDKDDLHERDS